MILPIFQAASLMEGIVVEQMLINIIARNAFASMTLVHIFNIREMGIVTLLMM